MTSERTRPRFTYHAVWRWHFYAALLCVPFVIWLALTGALYLWKPQAEAWLDRRFDHLAVTGSAASPDAQVAAALTAVPGSVLHKYLLPQTTGAAVRMLVTKGGEDARVYVDPRSLAVLNVVTESKRPFPLLFHLHGELLAGAWGSYLVEVAACWAIVMLLTGVYLWWPRDRRGLAGVLYPRFRSKGRLFWRDLHAVAGIWVSMFALGLILTGLPWAKGWGTYLTEVRQLTGAVDGPVDWLVGGKPLIDKSGSMTGNHAGHGGMMPAASVAMRPGELARVIATVRPLGIAPVVAISPPGPSGAPWRVVSETDNQPLRTDLEVDGATGRIVQRIDFAQRHWIDRAIGYGIAVHEGALFGLANQLLGTATALLLVVLAISGAVMWWRRRPVGLLGAPLPLSRPRFGLGLVAAIVALGLSLPLFGLTLVMVLLADRTLLRRIPKVRRWLGLRSHAV